MIALSRVVIAILAMNSKRSELLRKQAFTRPMQKRNSDVSEDALSGGTELLKGTDLSGRSRCSVIANMNVIIEAPWITSSVFRSNVYFPETLHTLVAKHHRIRAE